MAHFDEFLSSLENIPPDVKRNFTLMTDLDKRSLGIIEQIDECLERYKICISKSGRLAIRRETDELFEKLIGYANDKVDLSLQTYDAIDRSIQRLLAVDVVKDEDQDLQIPVIDMPVGPHEPKYCICQGFSSGSMIACDNKECPIEWFHFQCVGLIEDPGGKWYCDECKREMTNQKQSSKSSKKKKRRK